MLSSYGTWSSPISAASLASHSIGLASVRVDGHDIYWLEIRPQEAGLIQLFDPPFDKSDLEPGYISMDSPLARALMKKGLDDEVTVEVPGGQRTLVIVDVSYESGNE